MWNDGDASALRNIYLIMHSCQYDAEAFIAWIEENGFDGYSGTETKTPEDFNPRLDVFSIEK